jgi:hypothetical protein
VLNHSRSPKPALRIAVRLSARTPPHEIAALREAVFAYVDEHPKAWRYASIVHIDGFELGEGRCGNQISAAPRHRRDVVLVRPWPRMT